MTPEVRFALSATTVAERFFAQFNKNHEMPTLVLFRGESTSPCGQIRTAAYCPADLRYYVDIDALAQRWSRFGAAVIAKVLWHEYAHWWQDVEEDKLFLYGKVDNRYDREVVELPADCWTGRITRFSNLFTDVEVQNGASLFGTIGSGVNSTHGSNEQRRNSFQSCYDNEISRIIIEQ